MVVRTGARGPGGLRAHVQLRGVLGLVLLVLALQVLVAAQPEPQPLSRAGSPIVVVGVEGLVAFPTRDLELPWTSGRPVSAAAISEPASVEDECALSVWATLGAGRTTSLGPTCTLPVAHHRIGSWPQLQAASAEARPDARLGTLGSAVPGCVEAVGPDAAVAAARSDGTVDAYTTLDEFVGREARTSCGLTLVDAGTAPRSALVSVLRRRDATVVILGIRREASGQAVEALDWIGSTPPGWLTSPSTRRTGVVTLPDLTRTLVAAASRGSGSSLPLDGALLEVRPAQLSSTSLRRETRALQAQPHALTVAASVLGGLLGAGVALFVVSRRRGDHGLSATLLAAALVLPAALALAAVVPWQRAPGAAALLVGVVLAWTAVLTLLVSKGAQVFAVPTAVLAAGATTLVLSADAASGGVLERSSLLDLRPLDGGRWYGFGNTTFAVYATAVVVLVGWLAARASSWAAGAVLAALALVCEASPTMGADLGGVIALAPPLLWLLVRSRGRSVSALRLVALGAAALALAASAAVLDWLRGPQRRTHLGAFVQHVVDGSAGAVVARKAGAVLSSLLGPSGFVALGLIVVCWWRVLRRLGSALPAFPRLRLVVAAAAATSVLGTALNDSGAVVGAVLSCLLAVTVASLAEERHPRPDGARRAARDASTGDRRVIPPAAQVLRSSSTCTSEHVRPRDQEDR